MPEGDTILHAARRVGAALVGREILAIESPQPRHRHDRWPERLAGRAVQSVDSHGKHLFLRFEGDIWKSESCFAAEIDPWRRVTDVTDAEAARIVRCARPLMQASAEHGGTQNKPRVYDRAGRPCPRCGTLVRARGQGDDNRTTYWCPACQR